MDKLFEAPEATSSHEYRELYNAEQALIDIVKTQRNALIKIKDYPEVTHDGFTSKNFQRIAVNALAATSKKLAEMGIEP